MSALPLSQLSIGDVTALLRSQELGRYAEAFAQAGISGADLALVTDEELIDLGVTLSLHRKRMMHQWSSFAEAGVPASFIHVARRSPQRARPSQLSSASRSSQVSTMSRPRSPPKWPGDFREGKFWQDPRGGSSSEMVPDPGVLAGRKAPLHVAPRRPVRPHSAGPAAAEPLSCSLPDDLRKLERSLR